jgi:hypothetical protein
MGTGRRISLGGAEYLSSGAAASVLGVSVRTVSRLRERGRISSVSLPSRGLVGQHWYRAGDVEAFLHGDEAEAEPAGKTASFSEFARPGRRSLRMLAEEEDDVVDVVDVVDEEPWVSGDGRVVAQPLRRSEVQRCPHCRVAELTYDLDGVARCERHGVVDLSKPEPVVGTCVRCGGEVVWEIDVAARGGFVPACEECGATSVHENKARQQREDRWVSFA